MNPRFAILLSTYNGALFLKEQIESIQKQTLTDWVLFIRDDGSSDATLSIIHEYSQNDSRIVLLKDSVGNVKPCQSFAILLNHYVKHTTIPFVFFCDQDDVWLEDKLALQCKALQTTIPTLVFSDLMVVNKELNVIHPSFLQYQRFSPNTKNPLHTLLVHNYITGCTIGMNRALAILADPIRDAAIMHDWWCALIAASCGHIIFIQKITVLYRQHDKNSIGAIKPAQKIKYMITQGRHQLKERFLQRFLQASSVLDHTAEMREAKEKNLLQQFVLLPKKNRLQRVLMNLRLPLRPMGGWRKIFWVLLVVGRVD